MRYRRTGSGGCPSIPSPLARRCRSQVPPGRRRRPEPPHRPRLHGVGAKRRRRPRLHASFGIHLLTGRGQRDHQVARHPQAASTAGRDDLVRPRLGARRHPRSGPPTRPRPRPAPAGTRRRPPRWRHPPPNCPRRTPPWSPWPARPARPRTGTPPDHGSCGLPGVRGRRGGEADGRDGERGTGQQAGGTSHRCSFELFGGPCPTEESRTGRAPPPRMRREWDERVSGPAPAGPPGTPFRQVTGVRRECAGKDPEGARRG